MMAFPHADADVALMLRVQRDVPGAFRELVDLYQPRVVARLMRSLHDRHLAEDLSQEVFLRLFRGRTRYQPRAQFATWLFHIANNVARNAVRFQQRHGWLRYTAVDADDRFGTYDDRSTIERIETAAQVRAGLAALGVRHRRALELQHFHDRSYSEIGRILSMTPKAAKCLLYRARIELREKLAAG